MAAAERWEIQTCNSRVLLEEMDDTQENAVRRTRELSRQLVEPVQLVRLQRTVVYHADPYTK